MGGGRNDVGFFPDISDRRCEDRAFWDKLYSKLPVTIPREQWVPKR